MNFTQDVLGRASGGSGDFEYFWQVSDPVKRDDDFVVGDVEFCPQALVVIGVFGAVRHTRPEPRSMERVCQRHREEAAVNPRLIALPDHVELTQFGRDDQCCPELATKSSVPVVEGE